MKRLLSSILALALSLGSIPAQAQVALGRVSLQTGRAAPTPVSGISAQVTGTVMPTLSVPALSASLMPAPFAPISDAPLRPLKAIPISAHPLLAAPIAMNRLTPMDALRAAAMPAALPRAGGLFDGALTRSAASTGETRTTLAAAAKPRPSLLQRYRDSRGKHPLQNAFGKALFLTTLSAVTVPALWGAVPAMKIGYAFSFSSLLMLAVIIPLALGTAVWNKLKKTPHTASKPPPTRRAKLAVVTAGIILGLGFAVTPFQAVGPAVQHVQSQLDRNRAPAEQQNVKWISGGAVEDEAVKILSGNPIGREILDGLRDRGGVLRMPPFFISTQNGSYAEHENFFDGVYLGEKEITSRGWTVEQFLQDPSLQRRLIVDMRATVLHELVHAIQGRRPPWTPGYFKLTIETEQEAFVRQMLYLVAELEASAGPRNYSHDDWMITDAADDLEDFLKSVAGMYEKNVVVGNNPYFNAFIAEQRARWPAYRVHIYQVLSARAKTPTSAKLYMDKAKAAAKAAGLAEPVALALPH